MPPKPRAPRKASLTKDPPISSDVAKSDKDAANTRTKDSEMLPPPNPLPPLGILEAEMNALSGCLKNAVVKTGQVYGFYADTRRLGIHKYAPNPPRALTASLGREVEKFDQLCDAMEAHLLRAITVLQRDLGRERRRLQEIETAAIASRTRSKSLSLSPTSIRAALPDLTAPMSDATPAGPLTNEQPPSSTQMSPPPLSGGSSGPGRRGSTISLSSLHRPAFPHKLDLSSTTLRLSGNEAGMFTAGPLASPVTLAPKSARPATNTDISHDFMAAFADANNRPVDIDLTVPDTEPANGNASSAGHGVSIDMEAALGNSADKPIELDIDIDMSDLFGDTTDSSSTDANAGLFTPSTAGHELPMTGVESNGKSIKQEDLEMEILGLSAGSDDLFASFSQAGNQLSAQNQSQTISSDNLSLPAGPSSSNITSAPSPGSILASFATSQMNTDNPSASSDALNITGEEIPFDFSNVFNQPESETGMAAEIEELLKAGGFGSTS